MERVRVSGRRAAGRQKQQVAVLASEALKRMSSAVPSGLTHPARPARPPSGMPMYMGPRQL